MKNISLIGLSIGGCLMLVACGGTTIVTRPAPVERVQVVETVPVERVQVVQTTRTYS